MLQDYSDYPEHASCAVVIISMTSMSLHFILYRAAFHKQLIRQPLICF